MQSSILPFLEALKFLRTWSITLLIIQLVIFVILASACLFVDIEKLKPGRFWLTAAITFSALSLIIALNVIGTLPWSVQNLPDLIVNYHNIYQFPNYLGIPIWMLAFGQHIFLLLAVLCLMGFLLNLQRFP
jgi:hypothetical protein